MPAASTSQQNEPKSQQCLTACHKMFQKLNWAMKFCFMSHIHLTSRQLTTLDLPIDLPILQASQQFFAGKTLPQPAGGRKCFPRVRQIPKHRFLRYTNKQTYFSLAKSVDCNGSYFD